MAKRDEIITYLDSTFNKSHAIEDDVIGLIVKGKEEVKKVFLTLDLTLDVLSDAIEKGADLIISHHPPYFGDLEKEKLKDKFIEPKLKLLKDKNINYFVIHTNADYNQESISKNQAKAILKFKSGGNMTELKNAGTLIHFEKKISKQELMIILFEKLGLDKNEANSNLNELDKSHNVLIGSGASGDLVYNLHAQEAILIIGEVKYHHWIFAKEHNIKIIEIGHSSERIFKNIIDKFLKDKFSDLKTILSEEDFESFKKI